MEGGGAFTIMKSSYKIRLCDTSRSPRFVFCQNSISKLIFYLFYIQCKGGKMDSYARRVHNQQELTMSTTNRFEFDTAHSTIGFSIRHLMVSKVRGAFTQWSGSLAFDENDLANAEVNVEIQAASIDTHEKQRDDHLRSADFFDAANHPRLTFRAKGAQKTGEGRYRVSGELTIRGTTRPVDLEVEYNGRAKDPWGGERVGFEAHTSINRKDFGLTWNQALETGGVLVGEKIEINLEVQAKAVAAAAAA